MMNKQDLILDDAFKAYNQGDFQRAEGLARGVLTLNPAHGDALYLLGLIAYRDGALEPASELLFQAVKLYPKIENYTLMLASVLQKQKRWDEALTYYEKCPNNPKGLTQQGFIYLQQKQQDTAKNFFQKALGLSPDLPEARLGMALCTQDEHALEDVAEKFNLPDAWYQLARLYLDKNKPAEALYAIDKTGLLEISYLIQKGLILEKLGEANEALALYKKAGSLDPYRADVWSNQANIFRDKKEYAAAEDYYKRALAQDFDDIPSRHNLAELLGRMGRIAEALEQYRSVLIREPGYVPSLYNLAIILENRGEYAEALGLYFKVLLQQKFPPDIDWRITDSISKLALSDQKNQHLALDFATGWIKNFPENVVAAHTYAALSHTEDKHLNEYVKALYDSFSETYDEKMQELDSKALRELIALLPTRKYTDTLDLGCGTGAFGRAFAPHIQQITGVDLSQKMLDKAQSLGIYHQLHCDDVLSFLKSRKKKYDLIVAVEMLGYCSDIKTLIGLIARHLKARCLCAFTVETTPTGQPILGECGRYLYPAAFVAEVLKKNKLAIKQQRFVALRKEGKGYANGLIILASQD